jgi:cytoskeletal protein CcmA (bactofilin family)
MSAKSNFMQALNEIGGDKPAEQPAAPSRPTPAPTQPADPSARTVITRDTRIVGSVTTSSALDIAGTIVGDIVCDADMRVTGRIEGSVAANSIEMAGSRIKGDVTVKGTAFVRQGSVTVGNLTAKTAEINGNVKGDLAIEGAVQILDDAHVVGDVKADVLEITRGAAVQGRLLIRSSEGRPDPFADL